ncbi:MAG: arginine--tRNA ligase [Candidatus Liptonbacteria bacterium]|nr:arginine--tRNA ligase [Candidatus Liptonbacteria bacterium]
MGSYWLNTEIMSSIQTKISSIIKNVAGEASASAEIRVPEGEALGHYATNVAFALAKVEKKNPGKVAEEVVSKIRTAAPKDFFSKIEATPKGFINFWLTPEALQAELSEMLNQKEKYGASNILNGRKIQLEFISANPTGPLTLANGRGGFLGDALANILSAFGGKVEREYYVNDAGNQIITLGKSALAAAGKIPDEEKFYKGEYIKEWAAAHADEVKAAKEPLVLGKRIATDLLKSIRHAVEEKAGIRFDRWASEDEDVHKKGFVKQAEEMLREKGLVYERDGATWLKTTQFGDDKDRVIITSDKYPTYFLAEVGYFLETKERGFDEKILILGPDHYGYVKRAEAAAHLMGLDRFEAIVTQAVRLVEDGKEMKMSKRRGEFVTLEELIDEVGPDVARFFFLQVSPEAHMDFDLGLAKEHSAKNPVYYAQYAYVRAKNILEKGGGRKAKPNTKVLSKLNTEAELRLMRTLVRLPEFLEEALKNHRVHHLAHFAVTVAKSLHAFYEQERVLEAEVEEREARLLLVQGAVTVLENLLSMLGVSKPEKM